MRNAFAALVVLLTLARAATPCAAAPEAPRVDSRPWIVVSDIHLQPYGRQAHALHPSWPGTDTNYALFDSFLAVLARTVPNPPVIFIAGDFLGHSFPPAHASATMAYLAMRFDRAFPHTQFVIALGNNDSACGDYEATPKSPFLAATAKAWAPLVNRNGAAPDFVRSFSRFGGYVARLPRPGLRAVVVDDVYDALRYRNACGTGNPAGPSLVEFGRRLAAPASERSWVVTHIPPGVDAYSTAHIGHRLFVVPFLRPVAREQFVDLLDDPAHHVGLVIAGHTHHFSFRLGNASHPDRDVPILIAPSISPIFDNAPSFLELDVAPSGIVRNVAETSFVDGTWQRMGDLASDGVASFTPSQLLAYQSRLDRDPALRAAYERFAAGGGVSDIDARGWPVYRCAMSELSVSQFSGCTETGGLSVLTGRAFRVIELSAAFLGLLIIAITIRVRRARAALRPPAH
jgi:hypothetical protein